jgi:hypothetical protein
MRTNRLTAVVIAAALLVTGGAVVAVAATGGGSSWSSGVQMMGGRSVYRPARSTPVRTLAAARSDAQQLASRLGLRVDEVLQFQRNFYAKLVDAKGNGATEVLVDPSSGLASIEYGPAMMWNNRYGMGRAGASMMGSYGASMMGRYGSYRGMMGGSGQGSPSGSGSGSMMGGAGYGGMMGGSGGAATQTPAAPSASGTVSLADAHTLAQRWLNANESGVSVESGGDAFPGYYTLETLKGGKITGMISVNASTGAVWPHWWHGAFVAKSA